MKKISLSFLIIISAFILTSCVSVDNKLSPKKIEKVSFSVVSTKNKNGDISLMGSGPLCSIKWSVSKGILTHRMSCETETKDELWAYLLGMATRLKEENSKAIYFVRYTSKDFPLEEVNLGRVFSKSKMWRKLNKENIKQKKYKEFSNKFLTKVIEKKGVLSMVPRALNAVGYNFKVDKVEIVEYKTQRNKVLRPVGSRVVFKSSRPNKNQHKNVKSGL